MPHAGDTELPWVMVTARPSGPGLPCLQAARERHIHGNDEIKNFIDGLYLSPPEAVGRLFKFPLSARLPAVTRLTLHEEDRQLIHYQTAEGALGQVDSGKAEQTTLTEFFKLNLNDERGADGMHARRLYYKGIPAYFWWDKPNKKWMPQKRREATVGRIFSISYLAGERFYLRTLLLHRRGVTSFEDLKKVNGVLHTTFRDVCNSLGLLIDDFLYDSTLKEASFAMSAFRLTQMFALMCVHTPPGDPMALFQGNYKAMTDDSMRLDMAKRDSRQLSSAERKVICLFRLEKILTDLRGSLEECNMKICRSQREAMRSIRLERDGFEPEALVNKRLEESIQMFNAKQHDFFNHQGRFHSTRWRVPLHNSLPSLGLNRVWRYAHSNCMFN
ncbi:hypothetical protein PCASD_07563 [Puccinia coronata f. sp. avenae]|uniref:Helitron helicase-like domain-containing protein n=1 Tax=Puccinia coronata f. sp. avenae TaxID=200324 RepID=A0A2N5TGQ8_9BASI|nr:hypothetical protein PCASD_07563 [Puccinia coronata f. sp. avenae]